MYIKIVGDTTKYQGKLERIGLHLIKVSGLIQHTSGFRLYLDNDVLVGDYSTFVYPYLDPNLGEGVFEYSDNNMQYDDKDIPSKEEQERQKIENIIAEKVSGDICLLSQQMIELSNILAPMYEVILEIQDILAPPEEEEEDTPTIPSEGEPTDPSEIDPSEDEHQETDDKEVEPSEPSNESQEETLEEEKEEETEVIEDDNQEGE